MNRLVPALVALTALLAAPQTGQTQENGAHSYELPNLDIFELDIPPAWDETIDQPADGGPPTIQLHPREGAAFEIYVTPGWPVEPDVAAPDLETLRETVRASAERVRELAGEPPIEIRRLQGSSGVGYYFVAPEGAPQTEEFRYMNQGMLLVGELIVQFTILTNEGQDAVVEEAFAMLKSAVHRHAGLDQR